MRMIAGLLAGSQVRKGGLPPLFVFGDFREPGASHPS